MSNANSNDRWAIVPVILSVAFLAFVILFAIGPDPKAAAVLLLVSFLFIGGVSITRSRIGVPRMGGGCLHDYEYKAEINVPQCSRCGQFRD